MKPLVIGGTGFIGLNLVKALKDEGHDVICTKRDSSNTLFLRKLKPTLLNADCADLDSLRAAMQGIDVVFMTAAHYPRYSVDLDGQVQYGLTRIYNVLQAARECGVRRFIYTSSVTTLSDTPFSSVYFAVKKAMETAVLDAIRGGLDGTVMCVAGCFGPSDVKMGTGSLLVNAVNGAIPFFVDGKINIIDVEDVARAHVAAMKAPVLRERYVLAAHNTTVADLMTLISKRYGAKVPRKIPMWLGYPVTAALERYHQLRGSRAKVPLEFLDMLRWGIHIHADPATQEELLPRVTPLEQTMDKAFEWFKQYKYIQ